MLLTETGITYENNSITICYGPSGKIYALPISIINLPTKYGKGETTEFVCINKDVIEQTLKVLIYIYVYIYIYIDIYIYILVKSTWIYGRLRSGD